MRSQLRLPQFLDTIVLIVLLVTVLLPGKVLYHSTRETILAMDAPPLLLPRAGFHLLERFPDNAHTYRWTKGSGRLVLPNPGGAATVQMDIVGGLDGPTPAQVRVGTTRFNLTLQPGRRRYILLPPPTGERMTVAIDTPVAKVNNRDLGVAISDIRVTGGGGAPGLALLWLALAVVGGYVLLRQAGWNALLSAGLIIPLELAAQLWHAADGWRYGLFGPLSLLLGGTCLAAVVIERGWPSPGVPAPSYLRVIGTLLAAVACVRLPWLILPDPGPGSVLLGLSVTIVGGYALLRQTGWRVLLSAGGVLLLGGLALIWYAANGWYASQLDPALLLLGTASLTVVGLKRWSSAILGLAIIPIVAFFLFISYALTYFFLADDFVLVSIAQIHNIERIFTVPMIGFYRPLVFVLLKIQFSVFGWETPAGYMVVSIVFHVINALLVGLLTKKVLRANTANHVLASLIFFLSPWAGEALFWSSCQFDIFATTFMLSTLILSSKQGAFYNNFHINAAHMLIIATLALSAVFSKEAAATLPGLFIIVMLYNYKLRGLLKSKYILSISSLLTVCVSIYVLIRMNYMTELGGAFGGAYGDFFTLLKNAGPLNFTNTILMPPIFNTPFYSLGGKFFLILMIVIFVSALVYRPRETAITFIAFLISTLPVI